MDRRRAIEEAVHSAEMEGGVVCDEFRADMEAYIRGEITPEDMLRHADALYDHNRRGDRILPPA
ncbi:antitoxin VbhA family protein [Bifidobacterium myosotis]|uniref:Antitoxin VbhA domain-containing protein n=1 Tax=Bifidobacterium myosotis TaxID=1630166 RepID=A0A5M9ZKR9_9BIFI|nr:hypothetical protein [Bifidobacterium myosotis]KAA8828191.1 hypothetical protein EMO91_07050 [Bifidobacterium myosotis]